MLARAVAILGNYFGKDNPNVGGALRELAVSYSNQEKYAQAEPLYRRVVELREQELGPFAPELAPILDDLSLVLLRMGRDTDAAAVRDRADAIRVSEQ